MITAAITAAVGGLLALFGIKPGAYLVGVAIAVKILVVTAGLIFGRRFLERRRRKQQSQLPTTTPPATTPPVDI